MSTRYLISVQVEPQRLDTASEEVLAAQAVEADSVQEALRRAASLPSSSWQWPEEDRDYPI